MPKVYNKYHGIAPKGAISVMRGTPYGNPFIINVHGNRREVIKRFEKEILPDLDVEELRGKDLVCCCVPLPCHAESILRKANAPKRKKKNAK